MTPNRTHTKHYAWVFEKGGVITGEFQRSNLFIELILTVHQISQTGSYVHLKT